MVSTGIKSRTIKLDELNEKLSRTEDRFQVIASQEAKIIDRVGDALLWGGMQYLHNEGFVWIGVPTLAKITGACENVNTLYKTDHFGKSGFMAQTGQLYLEAKIPAHKRTWTLIDSTRRELEADARHLNQFRLLELEFQGDFNELLQNVENTVKAMINYALEKEGTILSALGRYNELKEWVADRRFDRLSYTQAVEKLEGTAFKMKWGDDLNSQHEAYLSENVMSNRPFFLTHFPVDIKFFNMRVNDDNPKVVNSADLIMPYSGESAGCAERENNYGRLVERLKTSDMYRILTQELNVNPEEFNDYLKTVREHPVLHSGAGIGFERIVQSIFASDDIRMSTGYPIQADKLY